MSKTINITGSRILIQEKGTTKFFGTPFTTTKFDTDRQYLKTDPSGVLKAGGYEKCPTFYGSGSDPNVGITDKDRGWWPTDLISGTLNCEGIFTIYLDIPLFTNYKSLYQNAPTSGRGYTAQGAKYRSTTKYITTSNGVTTGIFNWASELAVVGTTTDGYDTYNIDNLIIYPENIVLFGNASGVVMFPWENISIWTGSWTDYDNIYNSGTFSSAYKRYDSETNTYSWSYPNPIWSPWCLQFIRSPANLAISITS